MAQARLGSDCVKTAAALAAKRPWGGPHWVIRCRFGRDRSSNKCPLCINTDRKFWALGFVAMCLRIVGP